MTKDMKYLLPLLLGGWLLMGMVYAQQSLLQITSPVSQSTALEGQSITITVSADPSVQYVSVFTQSPLPEAQPTSVAAQFVLTLPTNIPPGRYQLTAFGIAGSSDVASAPVQIDVERQDAPVSISVQPTFVTIGTIGSPQPISVQGTFSDGSVLSLKNSSLVTYYSENTSVVTVAPGGWMTAVGAGNAGVSVQYGTLGQPGWTATTFQVTVPPPPPTGPAPVISSISPTSGTPGTTQVTITGSNFGNAPGSGFVQLGTLSATASTWTNQEIIATVPAGSMPGVALVFQNGLYSNQIPFATVVPSIASVSPSSGTGGTAVTISGSNFGATQGSSMILFNGAWTNATSWSNSSIVATVSPYAVPGDVVVIVNGVPSNGVPFTTTPGILGLNPAQGQAGTAVTISGSNFGLSQGTSTITFNGTTASPTAWSPTSISAAVPTGATSGPVLVTVNGIASNPSTFSVPLLVPSSGTTCNGVYTGTFSGNITVSAGQSCTFISGGVTGNITENGGNLALTNATVGNSIQINGASTFSFGPSTTIKGSLQIQNIPAGSAMNQVCGTTIGNSLQFQGNGTAVQIGSSSQSCPGNVIGNSLQVQTNKAATVIYGNNVAGNLQDQSNTGATQVFNNMVKQTLQCQSNSSITGGGNTATQKQGQCASF